MAFDPTTAKPVSQAPATGGFDLSSARPVAQESPAPAPQAPSTERDWATAGADTLSGVMEGGARFAGALNELSRYTPATRIAEMLAGATGGDPNEMTAAQDWVAANVTAPAAQSWQESVSPQLQEQQQLLAEAEGAGDTLGVLFENPALVGHIAAQQVLPLATQVGLVGRMAPGVQVAGGVASEAAQGAGETGLAVREQLDQTPDEILLEDPEFALLAEEMGLPAARRELVNSLAGQGALAGGVVTGILGRVLGDASRLSGAIAGEAVGGLGGAARRTAMEGASEAAQEAGQGGATDAIVSQADSRVAAWDTDARLKDAVLGAVMGATQGAGLEGVRALRSQVRTNLQEQGVDDSGFSDADIDEMVRQAEMASQSQSLDPDQVEQVVSQATGTDRPRPLGEGLAPDQAAQARAQRTGELGALFEGTDVNRRQDLQIQDGEATLQEGAQPVRDATGRQASPETYGSVQAAATMAQEMGLDLRVSDLEKAAAEIQANPDADPRDIVRSYDPAGVAAAFDAADVQRRRGAEYQAEREQRVQEFESLPEQEQARIRKEYAAQGIDPDQVANVFNRAAVSDDMRPVGDMRADQARERTQQAAQPAFDIAAARRQRREQALNEGLLGRDFRAGAARPNMQEGVAPEDPNNPWVPSWQGMQAALDEGRINLDEANKLADLRSFIDMGLMSEQEGTARARQVLFPDEAPTARQRQELNASSRDLPAGVNEGQPGMPRNSVDRISSTSIGGLQGEFIPGQQPPGPSPSPAPEGRDVTPPGPGIEDRGAAPADRQQPAPEPEVAAEPEVDGATAPERAQQAARSLVELQMREGRLAKMGLTEAQWDAAVQDNLDDKMDSVTGWLSASQGTVKAAALELSREIAADGTPVQFVGMDIANLGGLNKFYNDVSADANREYRALTDIVQEELGGVGEMLLLRTGGDEVGVFLYGGDLDAVAQAMTRAIERIEAHAAAQGYGDIPHGKTQEPNYGVTMHWAAVPVGVDSTASSVYSEADARMKKQGSQETANVEQPEQQTPAAAEGVPAPDAATGAEGQGDTGAGRGVSGQKPEATPAKPLAFHRAISAAREANQNGPSVHIYPAAEYEGMQLFLYDNGRAGYAITPAGGLVSVFKHPDSAMSGALDTLVPDAIANGATKLDAFEGFLTESYAKHGFKEVDRLPWDPQYAPDGWDTQAMGEPDVVIMEVANESVQPEGVSDSQPVQQPEGVRQGAGEVQSGAEQSGDRGGRETGGSQAPLPGAPTVEGASGPDPRLTSVAEAYARQAGIPLRRQSEYVEVDPARAADIADAYAEMEHAPNDPKVKEAYQDLIEQTTAQYQALVDAGYEFYFFDETNDPYDGNPWNAMRELRADQRMGVFATESGFGSGDTELDVADNPLLQDTGITWPYGGMDGQPKRVTANDLFRAVHDAFGHGLEGAGFRARGEENAWQARARLFTGPALGALTSETRGQNSWLNYGPHGETNRTASVEDTVFADQKTGLMPEWTWQEGRLDDDGQSNGPDDNGGGPKPGGPKLYTQAYGGIPLDALVDAIKRVIQGEATAYRFAAESMGELIQHAKDAVGGVTGSNRASQRSLIADLWRVTFATLDGDLRMLSGKFDSPTLQGLAEEFHATAGADTGTGQTMDEATQARNKRLQVVDEIISIMRDAGINKPETRKQIIRLVENPRTPRRGVVGEVANRIEKFLKEELKYLRDAGVEVGEVRDGYFPREMDSGKAASKQDVFISKATRAYQEMGLPLEQAQDSARAYWESVVYGSSGKPGVVRPAGQTPKFTQSRVFTKKAAEHLKEFMLDDIDAVLGQYVMRATRRAEIARRFGDNWANWDDMEKQMIAEDPKVQEILPAIRDRVALSAGVRLDSTSQAARAGLSILRTWTTLATLPKSAFASLGELIMAPVRGTTGNIPGDLAVALGNLLNHGLNFASWSTGVGRTEAMKTAFELAEDIGIIAGTGHNSLMAARFAGGDPVGKIQSTVLSEFFKRNMLEYLTNYTRVTSMRNGQTFVRRLARQMVDNPKKTGVFLRELGVPRGKEDQFAAWVREMGDELPGLADVRGPWAATYRNALQRFTDQTVMRPSSSTRPKWANHPLGAVLFQLQAFGYAFQKNVINRTFRLAANPDLSTLDKVAFTASTLAGFALLTMMQGIVRWARDELYNPEVNDRKTDWAYVEGALSQAGLFGVADPFMQSLSGVRYQKNPAQMFLGPALGGLTDASGDFLAAALANSPNTNTAERNMAKAGYDWFLEPIMQSLLTAAPGGPLTGPIRTAATVYGVPAGRDPFADTVAGPADQKGSAPPIMGALEFLLNGAKPASGRESTGRSGRESGRGSREGGRDSGR